HAFLGRGAERLRRNSTKEWKNPLRRFGFITTNSITQTFSRRVLERHLGAKDPLSLVFAVPDHPWLKASDKAAVRIAMTVAEKGERPGVLATVMSEGSLNSDTPNISLESREGKVLANLLLGANTASLNQLMSNALIAHKGVQLNGMGFVLAFDEVARFRNHPHYAQRIRPFVNGSDLRPVEVRDSIRGWFVIQALDGSIRTDRRPMGEDGAALSGEADGSRPQRQRQPASS